MSPLLSETTGSPRDPFFVTPRLWGTAGTARDLHDGRALTIRHAFEAHGGEGQLAADEFSLLSSSDQDLLLTDMDSLRTPRRPAKGIRRPVRNY